MNVARLSLFIFALSSTCAVADLIKLKIQPDDPPPQSTPLLQKEIEPTPQAIEQYLQLYVLDDAGRSQFVARLIKQIGNDSFHKREAAMRELINMPVTPVAELNVAAKSNDLEIQWRAVEVLRQAKATPATANLLSVLRVIEQYSVRGVADHVLRVASVLDERYMQIAGRNAMVATIQPGNRDALIKALASKNAVQRRLAVAGIGALPGNHATHLQPMLNDPAPAVRIEAAIALVNDGDRAPLKIMIDLMRHEDINVRIDAYVALRAATGQAIEFVAYADQAMRRKQIALWQNWFDQNGDTVKLRIPITPSMDVVTGHTLICLYSEGRVIEIDAASKQLMEIRGNGLSGPWGARRLANGNYLVAWYGSSRVIEHDPTGRVIWQYNVSSPWNVQRLANGNTLVGNSGGMREVDRAGNIVWQHHASSVSDIQRLDNGNTVATRTNGSVIEVNREGKNVWQVSGLSTPYRVHRLRNGNTLVTEYSANRVVEFDRAKKIVWKLENLKSPDSAQRLPNGQTLVTDANGVHVYNSDGKRVWHFGATRSVAVRY